MPNHRNSEEGDDVVHSFGTLISSQLKENFLEACSSITKSANQDLKKTFKDEVVENNFHSQIEALGKKGSVQNEFKMKREKFVKHFQVYQASAQKVQSDREETIHYLQEHIESLDNFMTGLEEKIYQNTSK